MVRLWSASAATPGSIWICQLAVSLVKVRERLVGVVVFVPVDANVTEAVPGSSCDVAFPVATVAGAAPVGPPFPNPLSGREGGGAPAPRRGGGGAGRRGHAGRR